MTSTSRACIDRQSGLLHLSLAECSGLQLRHVVSGIDEDVSDPARCGSVAAVSGYTEWISVDDPRVTLGWDWRLEAANGKPRCVRVGPPFSNVVLTDATGCDYDWASNLQALGQLVDALAWSETTSAAVSDRYS